MTYYCGSCNKTLSHNLRLRVEFDFRRNMWQVALEAAYYRFDCDHYLEAEGETYEIALNALHKQIQYLKKED